MHITIIVTFSGFGRAGGLIAGGGGLETATGTDFFIMEGFSVADGHATSLGFNVDLFDDDTSGICLALVLDAVVDSFEAIFFPEIDQGVEHLLLMVGRYTVKEIHYCIE